MHALRHWQPYLVGKEFTLRTDHNPNLALAKGKMKSYDTLTDEILQFTPFQMEFLNGNKMFVDALSRMPSPPIAVNAIANNPLAHFAHKSTPLLDIDILLAQQKKDPVLRKVLLAHKNLLPAASIPRLARHTHIHQGLVCRSNYVDGATGE